MKNENTQLEELLTKRTEIFFNGQFEYIQETLRRLQNAISTHFENYTDNELLNKGIDFFAVIDILEKCNKFINHFEKYYFHSEKSIKLHSNLENTKFEITTSRKLSKKNLIHVCKAEKYLVKIDKYLDFGLINNDPAACINSLKSLDEINSQIEPLLDEIETAFIEYQLEELKLEELKEKTNKYVKRLNKIFR